MLKFSHVIRLCIGLLKNGKRLFISSNRKISLLLDIIRYPYYQVDTSQDPFHLNFKFFIEESAKFQDCAILELGARDIDKKAYFEGCKRYIRFDIHSAKNIDIVGDIHELSKYFAKETFHAVLSIATFEHLAMPWKAILEINKVLKLGGLLFVATHSIWPPHSLPWDFWRFSKGSFQVLLNPLTGFQLIRCNEGIPCSVLPFSKEVSVAGLHRQPAYLAISVVAKKICNSDPRLAWNIAIGEITDSGYP